MRRAVPLLRALLAPLLLAGAAAAAPVPVRTGEHGSFTRVVVQLAPGTTWSFGPAGEDYELRPDAAGLGFDTSHAFDLIDRRRIAALERSADGAGLVIRLACACQALASATPGGLVVIDVSDLPGAPPPAAAAGLPSLPPFWARAAALPQSPAAPKAAASDLNASAGEPRPRERRLLRMADLLEWQISRAMAQGLVAPGPIGATTGHPAAVFDRRDGPDMPDRTAAPVTAETAFDHGLRAAANPAAQPDGTCALAGEPDPAGWGGDRSPADGLATLRAAVVGEFDRPDPEAVRRLAQFYLHHGFGAEARLWLRAFAEDSAEDRRLVALAEVMDEMTTPANPFRHAAACAGPAALWAVLADPANAAAVDGAAVVGAFSALPPGLRQAFGPRLTQAFLKAGATTSEALVRAAIARDGSASPADLAYLQAEAERATGLSGETLARLMSSLPDQKEHLVDAVVLAVETFVARPEPVPDRLALLAASLAGQYAPQDTGAAIVRADVLARGSRAEFDAAFDRAAELLPAGSAELAFVTRRLMEMIGEAPDTAFLRLYFAHRADALALADAQIRARYGQRLGAAGFADEAALFATGAGAAGDDRPAPAAVPEGVDSAPMPPPDGVQSGTDGAETGSAGPLRRSHDLLEDTRALRERLLRSLDPPSGA